MKRICISALVLISCHGYSQDIIRARYNATINCKIIENNPASVKYTKETSPGITYVMDKGDISEIRLADGTAEAYSADLYEKLSLQETKDQLVTELLAHAHVHERDPRKYHAEFTGDHLKVTELSSSGKARESSSMFYDLSQVHSFMSVSKRENDIGYLNIWVMGSDDGKKMRKEKFVLMVQPQAKAFEIYHLMKHLNKLLKK